MGGGGIILKEMCFLNTHWPQLTAPFSSILFETSIFLFISSKYSPIMLDEVREHLTRDQRPFLHPESLQIFRYTASSLQFISLIFYRVQTREHLTRDQRPSSRITPDPSDCQLHDGASSLQFTHSSSTGFRPENTWHEIRDHSFIQNHSRSSDSQLLLFSSSHSSSTGFRSENTWHEIRDHSFIQNHSRSSDSQLLLFSSLTHLLLGSDQRTPDTRSETIPSSRITPDLQIHSFFSSVHSLIFYWVQIREHLTRDQRPFLHPESLQIFRFTASSLQFTHSSSTGFRSENTWHEIRDHSFIQNHSRSSDSQLLLFSSLTHLLQGFRSENTWHEIRDHSFIQNHSRSSDSQLLLFSSLTHLLQGSGQRTPDTRSETIPSSIPSSLQIFRSTASSLQFTHSSSTGFRSENTWHEIRDHSFLHSFITPDLQIHSFFSSVHSLIFYRVQVREHLTRDQRPFLHPESLLILQIHSFFSSVHLTHLLQGSGQRTPDTRSEIIPSSRITPDLQIHSFSSSVHSSSTGFRSENTWHEIRDHSFIQNHSWSFRFTASSLQFTSLIFYRVQIREHLTRDQRPFLHPESLQIFRFTASSLQFTSLIFYRVQIREHLTRDQRPFLHPESLQIFRFTASSLQFISLIFYRVQVRGLEWSKQKLGFVPSDPLCVVFKVCVWIIVRLKDPNMAHYKISNRVSNLWIFYLLVFDKIDNAMCLNKMCRTSSRNICPQHKKIQQYISLYTWGTFYPCVHQTHIEWLLLKKLIF